MTFLRPPVLATEEQTAKARTFHRVAPGITATIVALLVLLIFQQPGTAGRRGATIAWLVCSCLILLWVNRRGRTTLAGALFVAELMAILTLRSATSGGINASAMQLYLIIVLAAGVLLGPRGGLIAAVVACAIGLCFALLANAGLLPPSELVFTPIVLWLYSCMSIGMAIVLQWQVSSTLREALDRSLAEVRTREHAEHRLRLAVEAGSVGMWSQDPVTRRLTADASLYKHFDIQPDADGSIAFETWIERVHPDYREEVRAAHDELLGGARGVRAELRVIKPDGSVIWVRGAASTARDAQGDLFIVGVTQDVTTQKEAEIERQRQVVRLQESEELLRATFDRALVGACLLTPDGRFQRANAALCRLLGYSEAELMERSLNDVTHPEDRAIGTDAMRRALDDGVTTSEFDKRYVHKSGNVVWAHVSTALLTVDHGRRRYFIKHIEDTTRLRKSEERFKTIFASLPGAMAVSHAATGRFVDANQEFVRVFGWSREHLIGRTSIEIGMWPSEKARAESFRTIDNGRDAPRTVDLTLYRSDGQQRIVRSAAQLMDFDGEELLVAAFLDVTEQRQAERQRQYAEQRLHMALDAGRIGVWDREAHSDRIRVDQRLIDLYGLDPNGDATIAYGDWLNRVHPDDRAQLQESFRALQAGELGATQREFRVLMPDGAVRHVFGAATTVDADHGGALSVVGVNVDVTERKAAELERTRLLHDLGERVKELGLLHETAKLALEDRSIEEVMRRLVLRMPAAWQYPECCEARISLGDMVAVTPGYRDSQWKQTAVFETSGGTGAIEVVYLEERPTVGEGPFLIEERALIDSMVEMLIARVELRRHQTELEELVRVRTKELVVARDEAERASRAKSTFLATMSHEIRTPMNAILGYAQLLQRDPTLGANQQQKVGVIFSSGDHLLTLLNDVLHMSRIEAGRVARVDAVFHLHDLLETVRLMFAGAAREKRLDLRFERSPDVPRAVRGDAGKVRQVLINLIGNALKFTKRGEIVVQSTVQPAADGTSVITLSVRDSGVGIASSEVDRVFGAFEQSQIGVEAGGTGLGLAIGRELARVMDGDLTASSVVGEGSTFRFSFRVTEATLEELASPTGATILRLAPGERRPKILVVDDQADNRHVLRELLENIGFEVRIGSSGEEAITLYAEWQPELVLMDLMMPGIGGIEAIRRLRADNASALLVALTASSVDEEGTEAILAGANEVWWKPYKEGELLEKIRALLGVSYTRARTAGRAERHTLAPARASAEEWVDLAPLLQGLPLELRRELREAAVRARASAVRTLADEVAQHSVEAAAAVRSSIEAYRYDAIVGAVDSIATKSEIP